ncbi:predicted protein [Coccidioides posadasii str. Silveira]|uniref:Predicted protein n=1 Tax=Coccidioides posadasii (strain RMSCC 757 / Silveira) TaxID=443226 RepID=E9CR33_COCPS|nr:predicted protein [Coccidioides posadasii str. Silveira]
MITEMLISISLSFDLLSKPALFSEHAINRGSQRFRCHRQDIKISTEVQDPFPQARHVSERQKREIPTLGPKRESSRSQTYQGLLLELASRWMTTACVLNVLNIKRHGEQPGK